MEQTSKKSNEIRAAVFANGVSNVAKKSDKTSMDLED